MITCITIILADMPTWMEELLSVDNRDSVFFRDKLPDGAIQSQEVNPKHMYIQATLNRCSRLTEEVMNLSFIDRTISLLRIGHTLNGYSFFKFLSKQS